MLTIFLILKLYEDYIFLGLKEIVELKIHINYSHYISTYFITLYYDFINL